MKKYSAEHLCYEFKDNGELVISITQLGESRIGAIVYVEYHDAYLAVNGVKSAVEIPLGVAGTVTSFETDARESLAGVPILIYKPGFIISKELFDKEPEEK